MNGFDRRRWMQAVSAVGVSNYLSDVLAAGDLPPGLHRVEGTATVNGQAAKSGSAVKLGDKITTGPNSSAIVVVKGDALLMRSDTVIQVGGSSGVLSDLLISTGKVLSVFSKKPTVIKAANATIGIRGTGAYIEVDPKDVYFCLCYGEAVVQGPNMPDKVVKTTHHEQPLLLTAPTAGTLRADPGPFRNHTDAELIMLEELCGREPPFVKDAQQYPMKRY